MGHTSGAYQTKNLDDLLHYNETCKSWSHFARQLFGTTDVSQGQRATLEYTLHYVGITPNARFKKLDYTSALVVKNVKRSDTATLRMAFLQAGNEERCSECGCEPFYNGRPLVLQLDHINGDSSDNRLENLRFLCPNCHTQQETSSSSSHVNWCMALKQDYELRRAKAVATSTS